MSREFAFVLSCVRRFVRLETTLPEIAGLDWGLVLELAQKHSVTPLVCRAVQECGCAVPESVREDLQQTLLDTARFNLALSGELLRVSRLFKSAEILAISLKGPVLAESLYGNLGLRSFSDIDLLVRPGDVPRVQHHLVGSGYHCTSTLHWHTDSALRHVRESQISFSDPTGDVSVDVHWRLLPGYFPSPFDMEEVWRDVREVPFAGSTITVLSPEHLILFLCAHGTKHLWERLGWICDIGRFMEVETDVDWWSVIAQARDTNTFRMLCLGLVLAEDMLGTGLPPTVREMARADRGARELAVMLRRRLEENARSPASTTDAAVFTDRAIEGFAQRIRFHFGLFFRPTEAEYRAVKLPPVLHGLYYGVRPVRLAAKYARILAEK